jgi:hypothetical protein
VALLDFIFGKTELPETNWEEMEKLMDHGIDANRYATQGPFTNQTWNEDKTELTHGINPQIQGGFDNMLSRINAGSPEYGRSGNQGEFLDAYEEGRMEPRERRARPVERQRGDQATGIGNVIAQAMYGEDRRRPENLAGGQVATRTEDGPRGVGIPISRLAEALERRKREGGE